MIWIEFPEEQEQKKEEIISGEAHVGKPEYGFEKNEGPDPVARDLWSLEQEVLAAAQDRKNQELVDLQPEKDPEGQFSFDQLPPVSYEYAV